MLYSDIQDSHIQYMFGTLYIEEEGKVRHEIFHLTEEPEIQSTIHGNQGSLKHIFCAGNDKIWTSEGKAMVTQIDRNGETLMNTKTKGSPTCLSIDSEGDLVFTTTDDSKIRVVKDGNIDACLYIPAWRPRGICHTKNGDMLVSLRSKDRKESKVVRYSGTTEKQTIQYDKQDQPLFSSDSLSTLHLTENGNRDICVADFGGKAVVIVNAAG
jgi:hypothetical protein